MKYFTYPLSIEISTNLVSKAKKFADAVIGTVDYRDSNQAFKQKIADDHFISKVGEEAVSKAFEKFTHKIVPPDYKIYEGKSKSWEADLKIDGVDLAVKTQRMSAALKYGLSWTFQNSQLRYDPILKNREGWVCFVLCDDSKGFECKVYPPLRVKELQFKDPVLNHLKGKKKVVYARDLPF